MRANWKKILLAGAFVLLYVVPAVEQVTETFSAYMNSLPSATLAGPADLFYILQGGLSKKITTNSIFSTNLSAPPPIGNVTPNTGAFTNLSVSGTATIPGLPNSVSNSDGSLNISPTTGSVVASINPGHVNTWTVTQEFNGLIAANGPVYMGNGRPWVDVRSGTNGCAAAAGNNATDDTAAIQCQINFMSSTYGSGTVYFPCGNYKISSGGGAPITVSPGVVLVGEGSRRCSAISTGNVDTAALVFTGSGNNFSGLRDIWIICDGTGGVLTNNCVTVNANVNVDFDRCAIWGGNFAINMLGTDSRIRNCFIMGVGSSGGAIASVGANFYTDDKFDSIGPTVQYIFYQGASATVQENHFIDCDFSATTTSSGITINDTNNNAITTFQGSITSTTVNIVAARMTMFSAMEFGGAVTSAAPISVVGSYGLSALTFTGTGARSCAGNTNITC